MGQDLQIQFFETQQRLEQESLAFHQKVAALMNLSAHQTTRLITVTQVFLNTLLSQPFSAQRPLSQWQQLLLGTGESLQHQMLEDSSAGRLLRRNTPFVYLREPLNAASLEAWVDWANVFAECMPYMDAVMQGAQEKIIFKGKRRFRLIEGGLARSG